MGAQDTIRVEVLGAIAAWRGDVPIRLTKTGRAVLATLVAAGPSGLTVDQAAEHFWGERQPKNPRSNTRMRMSRFRKALGEPSPMSNNEEFFRLMLPMSAVDAWALRDAAGDGPLSADPSALLDLLEGNAYSTKEDVVGEAALRRVEADRIALLRRVGEEAPHLIDDRVLAAARGLGSAAAPGDLGSPRSVSAPTGPPLASIVSRAVVEAASPVLAGQLRHLLVGRDTSLAQLLDGLDRSSTALLTGPGGSGKTRLLAEAVGRRPSSSVIYVCGHQLTSAAYGPFLAALPGVVDHLLDDDPHDDPLVRQARRWQTFLDAVMAGRSEGTADGQGTPLVIVDDAHWLDSASAGLVEFLAGTASATGFELIVAGRSDDDSDLWRRSRSALQDTVPAIELAPLDASDLKRLVGVIHPSSNNQARRLFARELVRLTRGLPAIARLVIENADPVTLNHRRALDDPAVSDQRALEVHIDDLPAEALDVGAAIAVIGGPVSVDELVEVTGRDEDLVIDMLDVLHRRRLIREASPERIEFEHILIRDAFEAVIVAPHRRRLHQRVAARTADPEERANHLVEAVPLVDADDAFDAVVDAARRHADQGLHREAAQHYDRADRLLPGRLDTADLVRWATQAERAGLDAHGLRSRAFDRAADEGDTSATLAAALSGLPEAEPQGGQVERVELLTRVDADELSRTERFELAAELARQYELLGRTKSGGRALARAEALASTPEQRARLTSVRRMVDFETLGPGQRLARMPEPVDGLTPHTAARVRLLRSFDFLSLGDLEAAGSEWQAAQMLLDLDDSPLIRWWSLLTESTLAWHAGRIADARASCEAARVHGHRYGLRNTTAAWIGQQWFMARAFGPVSIPGAEAVLASPDVTSSAVARAGAALLRYETTDDPTVRAAALEQLAHQAADAVEVPPHTAVVLLGSLARFLPPDSRLRADALSVLRPQRGAWIVFGTAVFVQGPTDLALADLATGEERRELLLDALAAADKMDSPPWRAVLRLELARRGLGAGFEREAQEIAAGTEFEAQVDAQVEG